MLQRLIKNRYIKHIYIQLKSIDNILSMGYVVESYKILSPLIRCDIINIQNVV